MVTRRFATKAFLSLLALLTVPWLHAEEPTRGVDVSLVSEQKMIAPAKPFTVALKVHHHPKYHTYWQNPGMVGVPISLEWTLPQGFTAGPIQWPYPEKVMMRQYPAYGYERDVMLLVEITPPATMTHDQVKLQAKAAWMACAEGCYPGEKTLSLELPVGQESSLDAAQKDAFAKARAELPQPLNGWKVDLESATDAKEIRVKFTREAGNASDPGRIHFYSSDGQVSSDTEQKIEPLENGFRLILIRSEYSPKGAKMLPGVLMGGKAFSPQQNATAVTVAPTYLR